MAILNQIGPSPPTNIQPVNLNGLNYYLKYPYQIQDIEWDGLGDYYDLPEMAISIGSFYFGCKVKYIFPYCGLTDLLYLLFSVVPCKGVFLLKNEYPYYMYILDKMQIPFRELQYNLSGSTLPNWRLPQDSSGHIFLISRPNSIFGNSYELAAIECLVGAHPQVLFIVDEAYHVFSSKASALSLLEKYPNIVCLKSASKEFSLPAIRLAWLFTQNTELLNSLYNRTFNTVSRLSEIWIKHIVMNQRQRHTDNIIYLMNERARVEDSISNPRLKVLKGSETCMYMISMEHKTYHHLKSICEQELISPLFFNDTDIYKRFMSYDNSTYYVRFNVWSEETDNRVIRILNSLTISE
ncbi:MAG: aminotransferase class I/II-fold pyridoxal phosphate-dependent enzyme [Caldilineaceae bacterium]|nr:aminotransferase class I/II-fold pyridoxal phosphate-dependent enzyme [Caldilineaceae bacterium]